MSEKKTEYPIFTVSEIQTKLEGMKDSEMKQQVLTHDNISRLQQSLKKNPSSDWMKEWIHAFAYACSCFKCQMLLKEDDVDTNMIDEIFGIVAN